MAHRQLHHADQANTPRRVAQVPEATNELFELQRFAGNQAVGRMLQRVVKVGPAGGAITSYADPNGVNQLTTAVQTRVGALPAWVGVLVQQQLPDIVGTPVEYAFDADDDVVDWIVLKEVLRVLRQFAASPEAETDTIAAGQFKQGYAAMEALRAEYQTAGEAAQTAANGKSPFQLFGIDYELQYGGPGHYYASRNGKTVVYGEFKRANAQSIFNHVQYSGRDQKFGGKVEHVDNFVCSFLAEPSRWPEEQVLNLLAMSKDDDPTKQMVGGDVAGTLPMAAGTTWNPDETRVDQQLPRRALIHAESEGIKGKIDANIARSTDARKLAALVARSLGVA